AVPAPVVVGAVAVVLAVGLVVLAVVGDEVVEREPVVAGDEVDALLGLAPLVPEDVGAPDEAVGEAFDGAGLAAGEGADLVAEASVPLTPTVADEGADLVQPGGVPG